MRGRDRQMPGIYSPASLAYLVKLLAKPKGKCLWNDTLSCPLTSTYTYMHTPRNMYTNMSMYIHPKKGMLDVWVF